MFSVTELIKRISQPRGGFIPVKNLRTVPFDDGFVIDDSSREYSAFASTQGLVVDYMTRFLSGSTLENAFIISLTGAYMVSQGDEAEELLKIIHGTDSDSIKAACRLVAYDVAFRLGADYYSGGSIIEPTGLIINNIQIMIQRSLSFLKLHGPVVYNGPTFEGGYTSLVSSGDADYLTKDGLWDFKVSKNRHNSSETLQILMYYIMGLHSIHTEFQSIKTLGLFNPLKNESYEIDVSDIPDTVFQEVSRDVLGYKVPDDPKQWKEIDGEDANVIESFIDSVVTDNTDTDFNPDAYKDGIHEITVNDYWTYYRRISNRDNLRPKFRYTDHIKFLKHNGFIMYISISSKGKKCVLQGGFMRSLEKPIQYYYENLPKYGNMVLRLFSKYWDAAYDVSHYVQRVTKGKGSGHVHGCIVDIDFFNHIYINPYDGTITPYYAESVFKKQTYQNLVSLIANQMPVYLPEFQKVKSVEPNALALADNTMLHQTIALTDSEINDCSEIVYDTEMYSISRRFKALQLVYDHQLIAVWYDSLLSPISLSPASQVVSNEEAQKDAIIESRLQEFVGIEYEEHYSSSKKIQALAWSTKKRTSQDEFYAIIRLFLKYVSQDLKHYNTISFGYDWWSARASKYVRITCNPQDVSLFYKQLLKERSSFQADVYLKYEATYSRRTARIMISFEGGTCPLAKNGEYKLEDGLLSINE